MIPGLVYRGLAMVFLGTGGIAAAEIAMYFEQPIIAAGYLLGAVGFLAMGVVRLVRAM